MEVLLGVLRELFEKQSKKSIDIFACSNSVADRAAAIREASVDGLIQEDDRCIRIPRIWVMNNVTILVDGRRTKFKEKACEGRTSGAAVEPENDGIVLWVVSRLKEPLLC